MNIKSIVLKRDDEDEVIDRFEYNAEKSQVKVEPIDWFEAGDNHTLEIDYEGTLSDTRNGGFFYFTYNLDKTNQRLVSSTLVFYNQRRNRSGIFNVKIFSLVQLIRRRNDLPAKSHHDFLLRA